MLPSRAYSDPLPHVTTASPYPVADSKPTLVVAIPASDADVFASARFARITAQNTAEAVRAIERTRPRVVAIDLDAPEFQVGPISVAAHQTGCTSVLTTTASPDRAPAALNAGCHAVLLKPLSPALIASRLGRLLREPLLGPGVRRPLPAATQQGTNRTWADTVCPKCGQPGAVSFEFHSYRRMWYACLPCAAVWLGPRRE